MSFINKIYLPLILLVSLSSFAETGKIALVQYNANKHFGDYTENRKNLTRLAEDAVTNGANIIVFPEGSSWGYLTKTDVWLRPEWDFMFEFEEYNNRKPHDPALAVEPAKVGPTSQYWLSFAKKHNVYVVFHFMEVEAERYFNTVAVASPAGEFKKYRKRETTIYDDGAFDSGVGPTLLSTPFGKFGLLICLDGRDKDNVLYDEYRRMGANGIILAMDWGGGKPEDRANAAQAFFAEQARKHGIDIYAADNSQSDGTGKYHAHQNLFTREGLSLSAFKQEGISFHLLNYKADCSDHLTP